MDNGREDYLYGNLCRGEARYLCNRKFQNNDYSELYFFVVQLTIISVSVSVMCHSLLIY
jgi:hypothetical protein